MTSVFYPLTRNVGDDLQVLALISQLSGTFSVLPRDNFEENVCLIEEKSFLNGWLSKTTFTGFNYSQAAKQILPISFHIANKRHLKGDWLKFFLSCEKLYTRDLYTRDLLIEFGIAAEFKGCLTMHLGKRFSAKEKKPFIICTEEKYLEELIKTRLPVYFFDPNRMPYSVCLNIAARISFALAWLAFIAEAKFVVTDRIHTAFPAISFDGNVNFPGLNQTQLPTGSSNRLSGFEALLNLARSLQIKNHEATESKEKIVKDISGGSLHILSEWSEMEMETKIYDLRESFSVYLMLLNKLRIKISTDIAKEYFRLGKLAFLDALKPVSTPKNQIIPDVVKDCFFWVDKTGYNVLSNLGEIKFDNSVAKIFYNNVRVVP